MPRLKPRPTFKPDDTVVCFEPFSGDIDGVPFVINPSTVLRGDNEYVQAYPWMFGREGDEAARAAYHEARFAEQVAERQRHRAAEAKRNGAYRKRVEDLADKLEAEERRNRLALDRATKASSAEEAAAKRRRIQDNQRQGEDEQLRALALAIVDQRLAAEADDANGEAA